MCVSYPVECFIKRLLLHTLCLSVGTSVSLSRSVPEIHLKSERRKNFQIWSIQDHIMRVTGRTNLRSKSTSLQTNM